MKKTFALQFFILLVTSSSLYSQSTFSKYSLLDFRGSLLNGVVATDSCYYALGEGDTGKSLGASLALVKFDLQGDPISIGMLTDSLKRFTEINHILAEGVDGTFALSGLVTDFGPVFYQKIFFARFSHLGVVLAYKEYDLPQSWNLFPRNIAPTPDSGYVMVWEKLQVGVDVRMVKIDKMGTIQWHKDFDKGNAEGPDIVKMDKDGGILVGGTWGNIGIANSNLVGRNYIFKTDSAGNVLWEYFSDADSLNIKTNDLVSTPDGGWAYASHRAHQFVHSSNGQTYTIDQGAIVKLDSNQNEEWEVLLGAKDAEVEAASIAVMPDGSIIAGGQGRFRDNTPPITLYRVIRLSKITPSGTLAWTRWHRYSENSSDQYCRDVTITSDGGILFGGLADISLFPGYEIGTWLVKTDSFGCIVPGCHLNVGVDDLPGQPIIKIHPNPVSDMLYVYVNQNSPGNLSDLSSGLTDFNTRQITFTLLNSHGQIVKTFSGSDTDLTWMVPVHDLPSGLYVLRAERGGKQGYSGKVVVQ